MGIICPEVDYFSIFKLATPVNNRSSGSAPSVSNVAHSGNTATNRTCSHARRTNSTESLVSSPPTLSFISSHMGGRVARVIKSITPILVNVASELRIDNPLAGSGGLFGGVNRQCLHTTWVTLSCRDRACNLIERSP